MLVGLLISGSEMKSVASSPSLSCKDWVNSSGVGRRISGIVTSPAVKRPAGNHTIDNVNTTQATRLRGLVLGFSGIELLSVSIQFRQPDTHGGRDRVKLSPAS